MRPSAFRHVTMLAAAAQLAGCATQIPAPDADHAALVAAERAFARHAEDADVRTAFLAAFAEDGIWMTPAPMRLRDAFAARPAPSDPRAVRLEWGPVASGVAASGDFGFSSGPSTLSLRDGSQPPRHGAFFSIWKRDPVKGWRVALDAGIVSETPLAPQTLLPSPTVRPRPLGARDGGLASLLDRERTAPWPVDTFAAALAADARLYKEGPPVFGAQAIALAVASMHPMTLEPAGGDMASSADLAYTYGAWRSGGGTGHYVHLWTRDVRGDWKIACALRL